MLNCERNPRIIQIRWYKQIINLMKGVLTVSPKWQCDPSNTNNTQHYRQSIITSIFHDRSLLLDGRNRRMRSRRSTFRQTVPIGFQFVGMFNLTNHFGPIALTAAEKMT